jgi:RNA polymerase sigma-70 factor, ECF subfamily
MKQQRALVPSEVPVPISEDAALIEQLRARSTVALAELYDRFGGLVYSTAQRVVEDRGAAEEITQDVFLRCWNNIDRYNTAQGTLAAWLLAIAQHRAIDELRSRRGRARKRELPVDSFPGLADADPAFDEALLRDEVRASLGALPAPQREAIELIYWRGLTRREAADELKIPLGTLHTRLRLAMEKLRSSFAGLYREDPP